MFLNCINAEPELPPGCLDQTAHPMVSSYKLKASNVHKMRRDGAATSAVFFYCASPNYLFYPQVAMYAKGRGADLDVVQRLALAAWCLPDGQHAASKPQAKDWDEWHAATAPLTYWPGTLVPGPASECATYLDMPCSALQCVWVTGHEMSYDLLTTVTEAAAMLQLFLCWTRTLHLFVKKVFVIPCLHGL